MIELEAVKKLLPKSHRSMITQGYLDKIEASVTDSLIADQFKDNFISYLNVLQKGKYKMDDYVKAVKFVSFKLLGYTDIKAYASTFPDRYERIMKEHEDNVASYVGMYSKTKLVVQIYEQTIVPTWVLNAPLHQEALTVLARVMKDPNTGGMTKVKAAMGILEYTKQPEVVKGELSISVEQSDTISDLREITENLALTYKEMLEKKGMSLKEIAEANIIDTSYEVVE